MIRALGGVAELGVQSAVALVRPPFAWRRDVVGAAAATVRQAFWPLAVSMTAWGFSGPGIELGNFFAAFGVVDRGPAYLFVAVLRDVAPLATAIVVAFVVGSRLTAELAERRADGELADGDASDVVAASMVALAVALVVLDLVGLVFGVAGGYIAAVGLYDVTSGSFTDTLFASATVAHLLGNVLTAACAGLVIGLICADRGLRAKPGAVGAAVAVRQAATACLVCVVLLHLLLGEMLLAAAPEVGPSR